MTYNVAENHEHSVSITNEEWREISLLLEPHHAVFYKIWQMGRPNFTEKINGMPLDTAAVQFDKQGDFIWFHFNPRYWKRLQLKDKLFVICHEALHIILRHGTRTRDLSNRNKKAINVALDIVDNHLLCKGFGFEREQIEDWQNLCWVDTVFANKNPLPPDDEMFEYYYNLFDKVYGHGYIGDGESGGPGLVDDHSVLDSEDLDKIIDKLNEELSDEEKQSLKDMIEKHGNQNKSDEKDKENSEAGKSSGSWTFASTNKVKKKKKWETVIKKWSKKFLIDKEKDVEQWARTNRRLIMLPKTMFLPSDMEVDNADQEKTKIDVWFFLDTSGSCISYKDRFFQAALSLPDERFDARLFCFDTVVEETTLESKKIYGGGGTSFSILEEAIQKELSSGPGAKKLHDGTIVQKIQKYPEAVFVITDGYGNNIAPKMPQRWHWFLTPGGTNNYIDKKCNFFKLNDFE